MARIKINNERFQELLNSIIDDIKIIHGENCGYGIEFNKDGDTAYITQSDGFPFYVTHLDKFTAILTLYNCTMWFDSKNNKPCLVFINETN